MPRIEHSFVVSRRTAWLLPLGLLAMLMHLLAGTAWAAPRTAMGGGKGFVAELCTSHGVANPAAVPGSDAGSVPADGAHECCKLCAAASPLLSVAGEIGVPPAPILVQRHAAPGPAVSLPGPRTAHPPRGPPAPG